MRAVPAAPRRAPPSQGDQVSPGTPEFHQVKLTTLQSARMLNGFFKSGFRASVMHVHCVFLIRGQDRLLSCSVGKKV